MQVYKSEKLNLRGSNYDGPMSKNMHRPLTTSWEVLLRRTSRKDLIQHGKIEIY